MTAVPPFIAWKMCWSKRRFKTFKAAKSNLKFLLTARRNKNRKLRVYFCPVCNNYHLTSQIDE